MIKAMRITYPSKPLSDPSFEYRPACKTDLSKTFAEARQRMRLLPVIINPNGGGGKSETQTVRHTEGA